MSNKLIIWEKWIDPFGTNIDDAKWTDYSNNIPSIEHSKEDDDEYGDNITVPISEPPVKVIASPLGLIPYNEYTASSKIFNFWLGHTNFNISHIVKTIIDNTEGVEILDIFTRYRFRIAIGKCFQDSDVMNNINENIQRKLSK